MDAEDAEEAVKAGVDGIVVSNHGGRQLDGAPAAIDMLEEIVNAVGNRVEIWMDSGIRSGQAILKALALGAAGTLLGRAYQHGLGAMGQAGVTQSLEILQRELDLTMAFCGVRDIKDVSRNIIL